MFMFTALNWSWKIPIGYALINGLNSEVRVNLINYYIRKLGETGAEVVSLVCDKAATNKAMLEGLGVNLAESKP